MLLCVLQFVTDPDLEKKLASVTSLVTYHLRISSKENDTVYFQKVPDDKTLPDLLLEMKEVVKEPPIGATQPCPLPVLDLVELWQTGSLPPLLRRRLEDLVESSGRGRRTWASWAAGSVLACSGLFSVSCK